MSRPAHAARTTSARRLVAVAAVAALAVPALVDSSTASAGSGTPEHAARVTAAAAAGCGRWMDRNQSPGRRASELLRAMTRPQKLHMLHQHVGDAANYGAAGAITAIPQLCIPELLLNDAGSGLADEQNGVTAYPAAISQAASFSPPLQRRLGSSLGRESTGKGVDVLLAPDVNVARVPLNGRTSEAFGEDPYLASRTGVAFIKGVQSHHVIATVKHYEANSQETDRGLVDSVVSRRALAEIYHPPFQAAVRQGHVGSVMCSYNKVNGSYACQNRQLLRGDLEKQMGFKGFVMSDWGATHSTIPSTRNGLDMEMAVLESSDTSKPLGSGGINVIENYYAKPLANDVAAHRVPISRIDAMVHRILRTMFAVGVFDHPPAAEPAAYGAVVDTPANRRVARRAAEAGSVLLKNSRHVLPLTGTGKSIAVIGADASGGAASVSEAGGSVHVNQPQIVTPLQGLTARASSAGDTVSYDSGSDPGTAAALAAQSDVAIVDIGYLEAEGADLHSFGYTEGSCSLTCQTQPSNANALVRAVAAANRHTIVVLNTGGPAQLPWLHRVAGVLEAWYPGQANGNAVAALLFGDVAPSGKLPLTFPRSLAQLPTHSARQWPGVRERAHYSEGLLVGYRWYDARHKRPLYPFGYGLTYTRFRLSALRTRSTARHVVVSYRLSNTGARPGTQVVQVYVHDPRASREPPQRLEGYRRTTLRPGHSARVSITLSSRAFAHWTAAHGWLVSPGCYQLRIGDSSRHEPLRANVARAGGHCRR